MELVWHMARGTREEAANTVAGAAVAAERGATRIEVDVRPIASGRWVLVHDRHLPDGRGIRDLDDAAARAAGLGALEQVVAALAGGAATLQIDLKEERLLDDATLARLLETITPLGDRVVVGSMIDWNLRALRQAAPDLRLAFDPLAYLHHWENRPAEVIFPRQLGVYGYWDDHPLATIELLPRRDYLQARFGAFSAVVDRLSEVMVHWPTLLRALDDGFDVVSSFHASGVRVVAWTLDRDMEDAANTASRLAAAGVDALVTNTAREFGR